MFCIHLFVHDIAKCAFVNIICPMGEQYTSNTLVCFFLFVMAKGLYPLKRALCDFITLGTL